LKVVLDSGSWITAVIKTTHNAAIKIKLFFRVTF